MYLSTWVKFSHGEGNLRDGKETNSGEATCCVEISSYGHLDRLDILFESELLNGFETGSLGPILSVNDGDTKMGKIVLDNSEKLRFGLSSSGHEKQLGGLVNDKFVNCPCEGLII